MQFNSYLFVLFFLPITIIGYWILNHLKMKKAEMGFLIIASALFYFPAGIEGCVILAASILMNYFFGRICRSKKNKFILGLAIALNIILLLYYKYFNFFVVNIDSVFHLDIVTKNLILPLGISFFTFQQISFLVENYKSEEELGNFSDYLLYILYFPKILMGPIVQPQEFISEVRNKLNEKMDTANLVAGIQMFGYGLFKKVIVADTFAKAVTWGFADIGTPTSGDWILIMLAYTFQIYFDFSGYSDMAVGISKMLNIELMMNFDSPYKAFSIRDFWKRWHISLTSFLTRYIYIPLGGNRKGSFRTYLNTMIVFLISGFWHGANWTYVLWGAIHGGLSVLERMFSSKYSKLHMAFQWMLTFLAVNVLWLLFRAESISQWIYIMKKMLLFTNTSISSGLLNCFSLTEFKLTASLLHLTALFNKVRGIYAILFFSITLTVCLCCENSYRRKKGSLISAVIVPILIAWSILYFGSESSFVYFGF